MSTSSYQWVLNVAGMVIEFDEINENSVGESSLEINTPPTDVCLQYEAKLLQE